MAKTPQDLMVELGSAIDEYLTDTPQIRQKIAEIKAAGYDVLIIFEATVALLQDDGAGFPESIGNRLPN